MIYQISSGQGSAECELGVEKFLEYLMKNYHVTVLESSGFAAAHTVPITREKTGSWISAFAEQPEQQILMRNRSYLRHFAVVEKVDRTSTR